MKLIALGIISSMLISSLPAKVWACGLNICPMESEQSQRADKKDSSVENSMPCHQEKLTSEKVSSSESYEIQIQSESESCPCPENFKRASYVYQSYKSFNPSNSKVVRLVDSENQKIVILKKVSLHEWTPPHCLSVRLHLYQQKFLV